MHFLPDEDNDENYRDIADIMTDLGYPMNHSSARNHVLRIMKKFANSIIECYNYNKIINADDVDRLVKRQQFQHAVAEILQLIESERRANSLKTI